MTYWDVPIGDGWSLCYNPRYYDEGFRWVEGRAIPQIQSGGYRDPHHSSLRYQWGAIIPTTDTGMMLIKWCHSWGEALEIIQLNPSPCRA
jgi:hypothetical protein